jgi:hypothetical protein
MSAFFSGPHAYTPWIEAAVQAALLPEGVAPVANKARLAQVIRYDNANKSAPLLSLSDGPVSILAVISPHIVTSLANDSFAVGCVVRIAGWQVSTLYARRCTTRASYASREQDQICLWVSGAVEIKGARDMGTVNQPQDIHRTIAMRRLLDHYQGDWPMIRGHLANELTEGSAQAAAAEEAATTLDEFARSAASSASVAARAHHPALASAKEADGQPQRRSLRPASRKAASSVPADDLPVGDMAKLLGYEKDMVTSPRGKIPGAYTAKSTEELQGFFGRLLATARGKKVEEIKALEGSQSAHEMSIAAMLEPMVESDDDDEEEAKNDSADNQQQVADAQKMPPSTPAVGINPTVEISEKAAAHKPYVGKDKQETSRMADASSDESEAAGDFLLTQAPEPISQASYVDTGDDDSQELLTQQQVVDPEENVVEEGTDLIRDGDDDLVTATTLLLYAQMRPWVIEKLDRTGYLSNMSNLSNYKDGHRGFCCRYCGGMKQFSSVNNLKKNHNHILKHFIQKCPGCPSEIKKQLKDGKKSNEVDKDRRAFLQQLWDCLLELDESAVTKTQEAARERFVAVSSQRQTPSKERTTPKERTPRKGRTPPKEHETPSKEATPPEEIQAASHGFLTQPMEEDVTPKSHLHSANEGDTPRKPVEPVLNVVAEGSVVGAEENLDLDTSLGPLPGERKRRVKNWSNLEYSYIETLLRQSCGLLPAVAAPNKRSRTGWAGDQLLEILAMKPETSSNIGE